MRVWIAEKPSAAKDLVAGLCLAFNVKSERGEGGETRLSNGDVVVPLAGHLLGTVKPGHYLSDDHQVLERGRVFDRYKEFLPILPKTLHKEPRTEMTAPAKGGRGGKAGKSPSGAGKPMGPYLLAAKWLKKATEIVNAGDTDREGQLIVDELLEHLGIDPYGTKPMVYRFGIASNLPQDIAAAVKAGLDRNSDPTWRLRGDAARAREYLDFVWGMNFSMMSQVLQKNPRSSAGRVQTPVISMVAERCRQIENFKPVTYFVPVITLQDGTVMRWSRREGAEGQPGFDLEGRIIDEGLAQQIVQRIRQGMPGECTMAKVTQHSEKPPLPFSLSSLQSTAAKELGLTLEQVGEAAKSLYQKHKAISYIGTDCKFLPESMHAEAPRLLKALTSFMPRQAEGADATIRSPAFNDSKLDEHYAIIPTGVLPNNPSEIEQSVYRVVARRFVSQFYPDYVYLKHKLEAAFGNDHFVSSARQNKQLGWREVEGTVPEEGPEAEKSPQERDKDQPDDVVRDVHG